MHNGAGATLADVTGTVAALGTVAAACAAWYTALQARKAARHADETATRAKEALSSSLRPTGFVFEGRGYRAAPPGSGFGEVHVATSDARPMRDVDVTATIDGEVSRGSAALVDEQHPLSFPLMVPRDELDRAREVMLLVEFSDERRMGRWRVELSARADPLDEDGRYGGGVKVSDAQPRAWTYLGPVGS